MNSEHCKQRVPAWLWQANPHLTPLVIAYTKDYNEEYYAIIKK